jgi:hypothetical protein
MFTMLERDRAPRRARSCYHGDKRGVPFGNFEAVRSAETSPNWTERSHDGCDAQLDRWRPPIPYANPRLTHS